MKTDVVNIQGTASGRQAELDDRVFGIEPNEHCIYLAVKQFLANRRQGTHKAKERSEIAGSTRKLFRQKGTGSARRGDIKSPLLRGGGRIFGPKPRDYSFKLNKKVKALARNSALSVKWADGAITVVEDFSMDKPSTKEMKRIINALKGDRKRALLVVKEFDPVVFKSAANLPGVEVILAKDINTYQILKGDVLLLQEGAVAIINELGTKYAKN